MNDTHDTYDEDDLEGHLTPMGRFLQRAKGPLGVVLAVLLVVPMGTGLLQWLVFDRAGDRVVEELEGGDLDAALVDSVLRVGGSPCEGARSVSGTAFVAMVDGDPLVLTNRHVVEDVAAVGLQQLGGGPGPRVASWRLAEGADVAVLRLADGEDLPPALPLSGDGPRPGDAVRTVGFPSGLPFTAAGSVAEVGGRELLLDMEVDPGASGSPVLGADGTVIGQVFARTAGGRGVATPVGTVVSALDDLGASRSDCGSPRD